MLVTNITLHNQTEVKTQALIFLGQRLAHICLIAPGETCFLAKVSSPYDIFLKNGVTGWEMARALNSQASDLTLTKQNGGWFQITTR